MNIAIVTGVLGGIGKESALQLLRAGYTVVGMDVVEATGEWLHGPFSGDIADGKVWGRGTVDTKGSLMCEMQALEGETEFDHIPDWYAWERQQVRKALEEGTYQLDIPVEIGMMVDYKAIYMVGSGRLQHDADGFRLTGCDGELEYTQGPLACYGLYSDYYWYEIADMICIGNQDVLYYCFPKDGDVVAKTRLAAEELYKLKKRRKVKV